ncbi:hypothetical protein E2C01_051390 [Portunus trituberculatus]|uniref:Uncharacterized protein n=1 Tax=Portunus trituberculatus TaxID=210409 RepID=A0A5B7GBG6_PORTR|nr:hypothetical protein [Portunus trituberculatus]
MSASVNPEILRRNEKRQDPAMWDEILRQAAAAWNINSQRKREKERSAWGSLLRDIIIILWQRCEARKSGYQGWGVVKNRVVKALGEVIKPGNEAQNAHKVEAN